MTPALSQKIIKETLINPRYCLCHPQLPNLSSRNPYHLQKGMEPRSVENMTNPNEECFNELQLTLYKYDFSVTGLNFCLERQTSPLKP